MPGRWFSRRPCGCPFPLRLIVVPIGRIARHLLEIELLIVNLVQSTLLRPYARAGIRRAQRRVAFLLLHHLPLYHPEK